MSEFKYMEVIILSGGEGRRLRSIINDRPKPMAEINQRPFLEILISYLSAFGLSRFILSTGYKSGLIKRYFVKKKYPYLTVSEEKHLLGTGGAIKKNRAMIRNDPFLVINGDSFCKVNLRDFFKFHIKNNALATIVVARNRRNKDCGCVRLDNRNRIKNFNEKPATKDNCLMSAGIYLFQRKVFQLMPKRNKFSLEYDLFPKLIGKRFYGYSTNSTLIDIGTPQGLSRAEVYFRRLRC